MDGNLNTEKNGILNLVADKQIFARRRSCWGSVRVLLVVNDFLAFVEFKCNPRKSSQQHIANLDDEWAFDYFFAGVALRWPR
jgi:hypothetical protein